MPEPLLDFKAVDDVATMKAARELIGEYLRWIAHLAKENYDLSFDVDAMVESDINRRSKFYPPHGRFYVIRYDGSYVGVGCLKRLAPGIAEIQRMYVRPHVRGIGAGRRLGQQLLDDARSIGYQAVRLESLKVLSPAHTLYRSLGFVEIPPYAENSMEQYQPKSTMDRYRASALFMELRL
jgi:GNAT superfamily N-acetyltransferase